MTRRRHGLPLEDWTSEGRGENARRRARLRREAELELRPPFAVALVAPLALVAVVVVAARSLLVAARSLLLVALLAFAGACSRASGDSDGGTLEVPVTDAPLGRHFGPGVPVTPSVAARLAEIAERDPGRDDAVFMKVGDSITVNCSSFCCFAADSYWPHDLGGRDALAATVAHFDARRLPDGTTSWSRVSRAAALGVWSGWPLESPDGGPPPLLQELDLLDPRFAVVLLGTNDLGGSSLEHWIGPRGLRAYAANLFALVEALSSRGVVPLLTLIPPVQSEEARRVLTPAFNAVVRGVAVASRVPTVDFYSEMAALGPAATVDDGVHPTAHPHSACLLTPEGLGYGYNLRNLRTLEVLDAARRAVLEGEPSAPEAPAFEGAGSAEAPLLVPGLPFAARLPLAGPGEAGRLEDYTACGGQAGAGGDEWVLRLRLEGPAPLRILVLPPDGGCEPGGAPEIECAGSRDVAVALFEGGLGSESCLAAGSTMLERRVGPGELFVVVDSFPGAARPDFAVVTIDLCLPEDPRCRAE